MLAQAPNSRPSPPPPALPLSDVSLGPVVMADDPCEAAFSGADPTGPRKYYRARYYDPKVGRLLSEDPIGLAGGINMYSYVHNRPSLLTDPDGRAAGAAAAAVGLCAGLTAGACAAAAAAAAAATAAITCTFSPTCRQIVRCYAQWVKDLSYCATKGLCPGNTTPQTLACIFLANKRYENCRRGSRNWPPMNYPPPGPPNPNAPPPPPGQGGPPPNDGGPDGGGGQEAPAPPRTGTEG